MTREGRMLYESRMRWLGVALAGSLGMLTLGLAVGGCSAPPVVEGVLVAPPTVSQSAVPVAPDPLWPTPPRGRAGWFELIDTSEGVRTTMISPDRCLAYDGSHKWFVKPNKQVGPDKPTPCNGDAGPATELFPGFFEIFALGTGLVYRGYSAGVWVAETPEAEPKSLPLPFGIVNALRVSGTALLATDDKKKLHRFDGSKWSDVPLDGGNVVSFVGTANGRAYVTTSKNSIYESTDSGAKWKSMPHEFASVGLVGVYPSSNDGLVGYVGISGTGKGANGKPGEYGTAQIPGDAPIREFTSRIRLELPEGVTNVDGVLLADERAASESLTAGRRCGAAQVLAKFAAAACIDEKGTFIVWSDDLGTTVREIYRSPDQEIQGIELAEGEIFVRLSCEKKPPGGCLKQRALLLVRSGESWETRTLELPPGDLPFTIFDRRGSGGFFLLSEVADLRGDLPLVESAAHHSTQDNIKGKHLPMAFLGAQEKQAFVMAAGADDDGGIGLLVFARGRTQMDPMTFGYLKVSEQLDVAQQRVFDLKATPLAMLGRRSDFAVSGQKIILNGGPTRFVVSEDSGRTFKSYDVPALQGLGSTIMGGASMVCGTSGCDFEGGGAPKQIWRWGDKPLAETLKPPAKP